MHGACKHKNTKQNQPEHMEGQYHFKYSEPINRNIIQCHMNNLRLIFTQKQICWSNEMVITYFLIRKKVKAIFLRGFSN